jgi:hydroxymethylpyrimidine/phosphomethylpyrimidine kinase
MSSLAQSPEIKMKIPRALTIAGSDSSGGAGIQADLKTFAALAVYGMSAITALTSQNTQGINGIIEIEPDFVSSQIRSVVLDIGVDAVKTGMLSNAAIISRVCSDLKELHIENLVVDPVMVATGGERLLEADAIEVLVSRLFPLALVITPNLPEAEVLTGMRIESPKDIKRAAVKLGELGPGYVIVKGGHLGGEPVDLLYDGSNFREYVGIRHQTPHTHGTGCTFASALTALIARGASVEDAVEGAKSFIDGAIAKALPLGHGHGPVHHFHRFYGFE